jgi:hypothetical protein
MSSVLFDCARPVVESHPARNDIACFVGLARATGTALPAAIQTWLTAHGWCDGINAILASDISKWDKQITLTAPFSGGLPNYIYAGQETMRVVQADKKDKRLISVERGAQGTNLGAYASGTNLQGIISPLSRRIGPPFTDIPLPIESYGTFTALFDGGGSNSSFGTDYLAVAVRSFFAQGGKRCYVVRMDDPVCPDDDKAGNSTSRATKLTAILPGDSYALDDRRSWHGVGHLGGLPDVSFLAIPDLPILSASKPIVDSGVTTPAAPGSGQWSQCQALPVPNASVVRRNPGVGAFTAGQDVYFWTTFVNHQGEGTASGQATITNTAANDQFVVTPPTNIPYWVRHLAAQSAIIGYNVYEADVPHGSPAPLSSGAKRVNTGDPTPLGCETVVNSSGTGPEPSATNRATIVTAQTKPPSVYVSPAPRLTSDDYGVWAGNLQAVLNYLVRNGIRDIQFVAAMPLPLDAIPAAVATSPTSAAVANDLHDVIKTYFPENIQPDANEAPEGINPSTAFLQVAYPWLKTSGSAVLNESLEPADGALVGVLARNVLTRGAFTDAIKIVPSEIFDIFPYLPPEELQIPALVTWGLPDSPQKPLIMRVSLFGFTAGGLRLLSDVTAYPGEAYRPGRVHRLVSVILRAARQLGERVVFEQNGPRLWDRIESSLTQLLTQLWRANALEGATLQGAFTVRCDASTMTQNDLDQGRLNAVVTFTAAGTIELIRVTLGMETSGAAAQNTAVLAGAL